MILYMDNPIELTRKATRTNKQIQQSLRVQNQWPKISCFLYTNNDQSGKEIKNSFIYYSIIKGKIFRNKPRR